MKCLSFLYLISGFSMYWETLDEKTRQEKLFSFCRGMNTKRTGTKFKKFVQGLLENADINAFDENGFTPLMTAILHYEGNSRHEKFIKLLIENKNIDLDIQTVKESKHSDNEFVYDFIVGWTTLMFAAVRNHIPNMYKIVKMLIKAGANVNIENENQDTALTELCCDSSDNVKSIELLLANGANINYVNKEGKTIIHKILNKHVNENTMEDIPNSVKFLVNKGFDLNAKTNHGETILHYVVQGLSCETMWQLFDLFIDKGADPTITDNDNDNLLMWAVFFSGTSSSDEAVEKMLNMNIFDVNAENKHGITPLMSASCRTDIFSEQDFLLSTYRTIQLLIDAGANINYQSKEKNGMTALMTACQNDSGLADMKAIEILLDNKANLNIQDNDGNTAAIHLVKNIKKDIPMENFHRLNILKLLAKSGADIHIVNNEGMGVIDYLLEKIKTGEVKNNHLLQVCKMTYSRKMPKELHIWFTKSAFVHSEVEDCHRCVCCCGKMGEKERIFYHPCGCSSICIKCTNDQVYGLPKDEQCHRVIYCKICKKKVEKIYFI